MERVIGWFKRQADTNVVTYSRFGLPGDEVDDRAPPTKIYVSSFDDNSREYRVFGTHAIRAALGSAGVGMSSALFIFLSFVFEYSWTDNAKINIIVLAAIVGLFSIGMIIHWKIVQGIKKSDPNSLIPSIMAYSTFICIELILCFLIITHFISISTYSKFDTNSRGLVFMACMALFVVCIQCAMLLSIVRARNYLEKKGMHMMEVQVAERSKRQHPGLEIIYVSKFERVPPAATCIVETIPSNGIDHNTDVNATVASPPPRVILAANDEIA